MNNEDKAELTRLALRMASKSAQAAALNGFSLMLLNNGDADMAAVKRHASEKAVGEAEETLQEFRAYLDML